MSSTKTSRIGSIIAFVISGIFVASALWLVFNRQQALDQLAVWSYEPTSQMQSVSDKVEFTDQGEFIFFATQPEIASQESFNSKCPRQEAGSPILGCYTTNDRIFIYDITNQQLDGMEEVTAAHEMLHAAWFRLSQEERDELGAELEAAYEKLDIPELTTRMEYYIRTEPGEYANELHSILGTEVADLGESLESYYAQFFNRAKVLALHQQYSGVYLALKSRVETLFAQMQALSTTIQSQSDTYDAQAAQLSSDINSFNARAQSGEFSSQAAFNAERNALLRRSSDLESQRQSINTNIEIYNRYYNEYQDIAAQIDVLNDSIDSYKQIDEAPTV